jgi:SAM-dependent methyltransferase
MLDFSRRATDPELLDLGVSDYDMGKSLSDLRFVNRWLSNSGRFVRTVLASIETCPAPAVLDVGCGSADLLDRVRREYGRRQQSPRAHGSPLARLPAHPRQSTRSLLPVGLDIKWRHLMFAPPSVRAVVSDVRHLPFRKRSFDVVTASLFLHHLDDGELPGVLAALFALTRRALVISDLRRSRVPYLFGRVAFPLLFASGVSVNDGLISIRRGFRPPELARAFEVAGIPVRIAPCWPYRLLAVARRM